jgi:hypothetical protein
LASASGGHVFPYREEEMVKGTRVLRPTLDIDIATGVHEQRAKALVDTGALRCYFPRGVGEAIGIRFGPEVSRDDTIEIAGAARPVIVRMVTLALPDDPTTNWDTEVCFFMEEWDLNYGLLGHEGFLDRFVVSFNYSENYFVIERPEAWERPPTDRTPPADPFEEFQKNDPSWWPPR